MLYDIDTISYLRHTHNILGVLIGTLPQIPQQNVFLGLPLELMPEEARLLVEKGVGYLVDDLEWHEKSIRRMRKEDTDAIRADMEKDGLEVAKGIQKAKQTRTQTALENRQVRQGAARIDPGSSPASEDAEKSTSDSLFETTPAPQEITQSKANPDFKSWAITPTTSFRNFQPPSLTCPTLPKVHPASYALFRHLHENGYFMTPGLRFGCQFSVYPGDPLRFHSHFLAVSADWDEEFDLLDLVGGGRLGTGVKKGWLIGGEEKDKMGEEDEAGAGVEAKVRTFCIEWGGM